MSLTLHRAPFADLEHLLVRRLADQPRPDVVDHVTTGQIAAELGVTIRTITRWRRSGLLPEQADRAATRLGLHPCLVWGENWDGLAS